MLGGVLMSEEGPEGPPCCGIGVSGGGGYIKPGVHRAELRETRGFAAAFMWSQRSPLLLSNLDLQHPAFGPVCLSLST